RTPNSRRRPTTRWTASSASCRTRCGCRWKPAACSRPTGTRRRRSRGCPRCAAPSARSARCTWRSEERRVGKEGRARWGRDQAEDGIRDFHVTGVQTCALPISDPELAAAANNAMDRIVGILPDPLRLQVETGGLFAPDWHPAPPEPWLPTLRRAIREERALHM